MPSIKTRDFGSLNGSAVTTYRMRNANGLSAELCSYGARLISLVMPDRNGSFADIVLGFNDLGSYVRSRAYHGATCGRFSNRIRGGSLHIGGEHVQLSINDGPNHLHGGQVGFDQRNWSAQVSDRNDKVTFSLLSAHGDQGYPGRLSVCVSYSLNQNNELLIESRATTDMTTIVSVINHTYWNLAGEDARSLDGHRLTINADKYLPVDHEMIPTGEIKPVSGSRYDFREEAGVVKRFLNAPKVTGSLSYGNDGRGGSGFDNTWRLSNDGQTAFALKMREISSGRCVEVLTNAPSIQFYTADYLDEDIKGKSGENYRRYCAFTMEPQHEPDAPNHTLFSDAILTPQDLYENKTVYRFFTD